MASVEVHIDSDALWRYMSRAPETTAEVDAATQRILAQANALGGSFRTGLYHRDHKSPAVGNTPAAYGASVETHHGMPVGIVHTANYSAMRDNAQNNTLLKSIG